MRLKIIFVVVGLISLFSLMDHVEAKETYYIKKYPLDYKSSTDKELKKEVTINYNKGYCAKKGCAFEETVPSQQRRDNSNYLVKRDTTGLDIYHVEVNDSARNNKPRPNATK